MRVALSFSEIVIIQAFILPVFERMLHQIGIIIPDISCNFSAYKVRYFKKLFFMFQLNLSQYQAFVFFKEFIDFPDKPLVWHPIPELFDYRPDTQVFKHFGGITFRNLIFKLLAQEVF